MDPVSAISLAAAIAQFVELGVKVAQRMRDFSDAIDDVPKAFRRIKTTLPLIVDCLRKIKEKAALGTVDGKTQDAVLPVVTLCLDKTKELDDLIEQALPSSGDSTWEKKKKAIRSLRNDKTVEQIEASLDHCISVLTFHQVTDTFDNLRVGPAPRQQQEPFWLVPFDRNASFVGRGPIFEGIEDRLAVPEGTQPKVALYGLGGIGKSQVALEFCYRKREKDPQCSVFWVNAATAARFEESFARIANECGLISKEEAGTDGVALLKDWLELHHEGSWVMVVDNVDDADSFFREKTRMNKTPSECIPRCTKGSLLFTTRSRDVAVDIAVPIEPLTVTEMNREEGLRLARGRLPKHTPEPILVDLLENLEYIPMAINQAVAFMVKRRKSVQQYLEQYRKSDETRTRLLSYEFSDHGRQGSSMDPRAAELLCLITFFQPQGVPAIFLRSEGEDDFDFQDAAAVLTTFSFIDTDESGSVFSAHRLVQLATRWWLARLTPPQVDQWAFTAFKSIVSHFPGADMQITHAATAESLLPHAEVMLRYEFNAPSKETEVVKAKLLTSTGRYINEAGDTDVARKRFEQARDITMNHLGEKHVDTMKNTLLLGSTLALYRKDEEAVPLLERLVEIQKEDAKEDDYEKIMGISTLACGIRLTGDSQRSEALQREAIERSESLLGRRHGVTTVCLERLATGLNEDQGRSAEALEIQREVYETNKDILGPSDTRVLIAGSNLAVILCASKDNETFNEGLRLLEQNIRVARQEHGPDHAVTLVSVYNLMVFLTNVDRFEEARGVSERAIAEANDGPRKNHRLSSEGFSRIHGLLQQLNEAATGAPGEGSGDPVDDSGS